MHIFLVDANGHKSYVRASNVDQVWTRFYDEHPLYTGPLSITFLR